MDNNKIKFQFNKVLIIGLGQLGLRVAKYVKDRGGFDVYGYDINTKAIDRAQKIAGIKRIGDNGDSITSFLVQTIFLFRPTG
jgi:UDP-N-acetyl-D-mannosaminuronate dehydrogenase